MQNERTVRLVATEQALREGASYGEPSPVYGHVRLDEELIQILGSKHRREGAPEEIGMIRTGSVPSARELAISVGAQDLILSLREDLPAPAKIEVVDVGNGMESRRTGLVPIGGLATKNVLLVGAGSVGSFAGLLLAEAGVGRFGIFDDDYLDASNLARHACDLADLGREKAVAVADLLARRTASSMAMVRDVVSSEALLHTLVRLADVVVASTDSPEAQFITNEACITNKTPGVFVGAYEEAAGGEVLAVRPGEGPCLYCAVGFRAGIAEGAGVKERRRAYRSADAHRLDAEPGLGVDVAYLAAVAAAHALAFLDPDGKRAELVRPGREFLLVHGGSTPRGALADLFQAPFEFLPARVRREEPCPVCAWTSGEAQ